MALIKWDKDLKGNYWRIAEYSSENNTGFCKLELYQSVESRNNGDLPLGTWHRSWKGSDYIEASSLGDFYAILLNEIEGSEFFPDKDEPKYPRIYNLVKSFAKHNHFHNINYDIELHDKLYRTNTFVKGELQKVEYFSDALKTEKVLDVDITYTRDASGFALSRITTRTWYDENNEANSETKVTTKYYDYLGQIQEGKTRRGNLVDGLQMPILGMMIATISGLTQAEIILLGRDFLKTHQLSFQSFINESHKQIQTDIAFASDDWLDNVIDANGTTIRDYILNELDI